ncbi:MAG TPA: WXG100 family type VII secretion target [Actinopolymorphaceae bacterium]|jgi:WXG100 family type VII secretion target
MSETETTLFNKGGIDQGAQDLEAVARAMRQELEDLETFLKNRTESWEGPARQAYFVAQGEWDKSFTKMDGVLSAAGVTVQTVGENYQTTENRNASMWG